MVLHVGTLQGITDDIASSSVGRELRVGEPGKLFNTNTSTTTVGSSSAAPV